MIYKIDNKYYVKVSGHFVEVELEYNENNVDLKPTNNKIEINNSIKYEEINFLNEQERLLKEHKGKVEKSTEPIKDVNKGFHKKSFK